MKLLCTVKNSCSNSALFYRLHEDFFEQFVEFHFPEKKGLFHNCWSLIHMGLNGYIIIADLSSAEAWLVDNHTKIFTVIKLKNCLWQENKSMPYHVAHAYNICLINSTFTIYCGNQLYWSRKLEDLKKTMNLLLVNDKQSSSQKDVMSTSCHRWKSNMQFTLVVKAMNYRKMLLAISIIN